MVGLDVLDKFQTVAAFQRDIQNGHIGAIRFNLLNGFGHVGGFAADLHIRFHGDQFSQAAPYNGVIVDDQYFMLFLHIRRFAGKIHVYY